MKYIFCVIILFLVCYQVDRLRAQTPCQSSSSCVCPPARNMSSPAYITCDCAGTQCADQSSNTTYWYCTQTNATLGAISVWIQGYCSVGSTYDCSKEQCVGSNSVTNPGTGTGVSQINCNNYNNYATFPFPSSNKLYYICINNQLQVAQCSANMHFNEATGSCSGGGITSSGYIPCPLGYGTRVYAVPNNCQIFILCTDGYGVMKPCPYGLYFDPMLGTCSVNIPPSCYFTGFPWMYS